jgi:hypothetical protein
MKDELSYTATGDGHAVWYRGKNIGTVRKRGLYWYPYAPDGKIVHGTFGSLSGAAGRLRDRVTA